MLSLIIIDSGERGHGLGKRVHEALVGWAKDLGAKSFRIEVIEEKYNCNILKNIFKFKKHYKNNKK